MRNEGAIKVAVPIRRKFITTTAMYFSVRWAWSKNNSRNDIGHHVCRKNCIGKMIGRRFHDIV